MMPIELLLMKMIFDRMSTNILAHLTPVNTPAREKPLSFSACEGGIEKIIVEKHARMGNWSCLYWYHPMTLVTAPIDFTAAQKVQKFCNIISFMYIYIYT